MFKDVYNFKSNPVESRSASEYDFPSMFTLEPEFSELLLFRLVGFLPVLILLLLQGEHFLGRGELERRRNIVVLVKVLAVD